MKLSIFKRFFKETRALLRNTSVIIDASNSRYNEQWISNYKFQGILFISCSVYQAFERSIGLPYLKGKDFHGP